MASSERRDKLFLSAIAFFVLWAIAAYIGGTTDLVSDRLLGAVIVFLLWRLDRRIQLRWSLLGTAFFALALHYAKLYGNTYAGMPFDRIMHFIGSLAVAMIMMAWLNHTMPKESFWTRASIAFVAALGFGAIIEVMEFVGYSTLQSGEGIFFYGTGDFGEYNNIGWDMLMNTAGAAVGLSLSCGRRLGKKGFGEIKQWLKLLGGLVLSYVILTWLLSAFH